MDEELEKWRGQLTKELQEILAEYEKRIEVRKTDKDVLIIMDDWKRRCENVLARMTSMKRSQIDYANQWAYEETIRWMTEIVRDLSSIISRDYLLNIQIGDDANESLLAHLLYCNEHVHLPPWDVTLGLSIKSGEVGVFCDWLRREMRVDPYFGRDGKTWYWNR